MTVPEVVQVSKVLRESALAEAVEGLVTDAELAAGLAGKAGIGDVVLFTNQVGCSNPAADPAHFVRKNEVDTQNALFVTLLTAKATVGPVGGSGITATADRLIGSDSEGLLQPVALGEGLSYSEGVLSASGGDAGGGLGIMLFRGTSTASIANVEANLEWADPAIDTTSAAFTKTSASTIRCVTAGTWKFTVQVRTTSNNRSELVVQALRNESAEANDVVSDYVARDTDQDTGGVTLTYVVTLAANDTVRFTALSDADGTSSLLTQGTSLFVEGPY
jgi:hypothetical protein